MCTIAGGIILGVFGLYVLSILFNIADFALGEPTDKPKTEDSILTENARKVDEAKRRHD